MQKKPIIHFLPRKGLLLALALRFFLRIYNHHMYINYTQNSLLHNQVNINHRLYSRYTISLFFHFFLYNSWCNFPFIFFYVQSSLFLSFPRFCTNFYYTAMKSQVWWINIIKSLSSHITPMIFINCQQKKKNVIKINFSQTKPILRTF